MKPLRRLPGIAAALVSCCLGADGPAKTFNVVEATIPAMRAAMEAGRLVFDGYTPPYDATLVKNLRAAGAVIIAKTGLSELANWVAGAPTPMPANYNGVRGFGFNPYDPRRDPRDTFFDGRPALATGGSSSGVGTAARFWAANVGSET